MNSSSHRPNSPRLHNQPYVGRFAPSPSGPLHFGSLMTALASFLDARHHNGKWLVRIEDIDPPREIEGATQWILDSLEAHGLTWDDTVLYQSQRLSRYDEVLGELQSATYQCTCSRARLLDLRGVYDSHCLARSAPTNSAALYSIRLNVGILPHEQCLLAENYDDIFQGHQHQDLRNEVGDFIVRRKDGLVAYQLAVVIDDIEQQISHIIRGSDLLSSTPRQRYLLQLLNAGLPIYGHIPVATNSIGQKLSKQNKSKGVDNALAFDNLCQALVHLHHSPPYDIVQNRKIPALLEWATTCWDRKKIPQSMSFVVADKR